MSCERSASSEPVLKAMGTVRGSSRLVRIRRRRVVLQVNLFRRLQHALDLHVGQRDNLLVDLEFLLVTAIVES